MLYSVVSVMGSKYAIIAYEAIIIVILFLIIMKKSKSIKALKKESEKNLQKEKNEELDNILKNRKRGARE